MLTAQSPSGTVQEIVFTFSRAVSAPVCGPASESLFAPTPSIQSFLFKYKNTSEIVEHVPSRSYKVPENHHCAVVLSPTTLVHLSPDLASYRQPDPSSSCSSITASMDYPKRDCIHVFPVRQPEGHEQAGTE